MERVFVYGTLRDKKLRQELSGREIPSLKARIKGFDLSSISDGEHTYPILIKNDSSENIIDGEIIELSKTELLSFDKYEGALYRRVKILLESGQQAWVYIQ